MHSAAFVEVFSPLRKDFQIHVYTDSHTDIHVHIYDTCMYIYVRIYANGGDKDRCTWAEWY